MKKLILLFSIIIASMAINAQVNIIRVQTDTTQFGQALSVGTQIYCVEDSSYYYATGALSSTETISSTAYIKPVFNTDTIDTYQINIDGDISQLSGFKTIEADGCSAPPIVIWKSVNNTILSVTQNTIQLDGIVSGILIGDSLKIRCNSNGNNYYGRMLEINVNSSTTIVFTASISNVDINYGANNFDFFIPEKENLYEYKDGITTAIIATSSFSLAGDYTDKIKVGDMVFVRCGPDDNSSTEGQVLSIQFDGVNTNITHSGSSGSTYFGANNFFVSWEKQYLLGSSIAVGQGAIASGNFSAAFNQRTEAQGNYSFAIGSETKAIGDLSLAIGERTTAIGYASVAMGKRNYATGDGSLSLGVNINGGINNVIGKNTFVLQGIEFNDSIVHTGVNGAIIGGYNNKLSEANSVILGCKNTEATRANTTYVNQLKIVGSVLPIGLTASDAGTFVMDLADNTLKVWDGSAWHSLW